MTHSTTYLLTWNSLRWPWPEMPQEARRVAAGEIVTSRWGCGRNKHIQPGDRLFMLKQGTEPRGIFASGTAVSHPFAAPHWDEEKAALGVHTNYVKLQCDTLLIPEELILPRDLLKGHPILGRQYWDTQVSGTAVKQAVLVELEKIWQTI
jgi:5-methylcytosine-specific restriction protein A